uniref:Chondroitin proteoglycan 4 domain-containing protein n=3 Tax=Parascaris univalens TaxID=6257 RepID=A0A915BCI7_PARUN
MRTVVLMAISLRFYAIPTVAFIEAPLTYTIAGCDGSCVRPLLEAIELAMYDEKKTGTIDSICRKYLESSKCIERMSNCKTYETFNVTTSGIKFMCVEQKDAFEALAGCIEKNYARVKDECLKFCNPGSIATGYALQRMLKDVPIIRKLDVHMPAIMTSEICRIVKCILDCSKTKFDTRCEGSAGSLLAEVMIRPLSTSQRSLIALPLLGVLAASLPMQCDFISNERILDTYRINPRLNEHLKRIYRKTPKAIPIEMEEIDVDFNPWNVADYLRLDQISPLEDDDALLEGRIQITNISASMNLRNISIFSAADEEEKEASGSE